MIPTALSYLEVCSVWLFEYIIPTNILRSLTMIFFQIELSLYIYIKKKTNLQLIILLFFLLSGDYNHQRQMCLTDNIVFIVCQSKCVSQDLK